MGVSKFFPYNLFSHRETPSTSNWPFFTSRWNKFSSRVNRRSWIKYEESFLPKWKNYFKKAHFIWRIIRIFSEYENSQLNRERENLNICVANHSNYVKWNFFEIGEMTNFVHFPWLYKREPIFMLNWTGFWKDSFVQNYLCLFKVECAVSISL